MAVLEAARLVAVLLAPVTPALTARVLAQLGLPASEEAMAALRWEDAAAWGGLQAGQAVAEKPTPVFARLEGDFVTEPAPQPAAA